jgi:hypothetical protein
VHDRKLLPALSRSTFANHPTKHRRRFPDRCWIKFLAAGMVAALLSCSRASSEVNFETTGHVDCEAGWCNGVPTPCPLQDGSTSGQKTGREQPPAEPAAKSKTQGNGPWRSRFSLSAKASSLGLGGDLGFRVARPLNLRVGFGTFRYSRNLTKDGVAYQGVLHLQSVEIIGDWFPFSRHSFHLSPGVLLHDNNRVTANADPPVGQVLSAGPQTYVSDPQNPIMGKASSGIRSVSPMLTLGFGNLVPRSSHFAYSVDFGVVYQGSPRSQFTLRGGACDPSGEFCVNVADDGSIQAEAQSARHDLDKSVSFMRFYPVVSVGFGYRF